MAGKNSRFCDQNDKQSNRKNLGLLVIKQARNNKKFHVWHLPIFKTLRRGASKWLVTNFAIAHARCVVEKNRVTENLELPYAKKQNAVGERGKS